MVDPITPPSNIGFGTVVWQVADAGIDTGDAGTDPDFNAVTGTVTFTPTVISVKDATASPNPITIAGSPVVATLGPDGYLGVQINFSTWQAGVTLVATDDPDLNPTDWAYTVTYTLRNSANAQVRLPSHLLFVPEGETVDLTLVQPPDSATPIGVPAAEAAAAIATQAALDAQAAAESISVNAGTARSTDGSFGLTTPTDVGLEFIIVGDVLEDIHMNGVSL